MLLNLDQIRLDGGTQPRAVLDQAVVEEYAELMTSGVQFPLVIVFHDGCDYWLTDGFHRVAAARQTAPEKPIEAEVHQGTIQDAQWFSYGVNKDHGLRRTNEDKARAVQAALVHPRTVKENLSNYQIAEHCGVSDFMVRKYRGGVSTIKSQMRADGGSTNDGPAAAPAVRTVTRRGTTYRQNTARIGHPPAAKRKKKWGGLSPHAFTPVLGCDTPLAMTAMNVPNDPAAAARGLVALFEKPFLAALVEELTRLLKGDAE